MDITGNRSLADLIHEVGDLSPKFGFKYFLFSPNVSPTNLCFFEARTQSTPLEWNLYRGSYGQRVASRSGGDNVRAGYVEIRHV